VVIRAKIYRNLSAYVVPTDLLLNTIDT